MRFALLLCLAGAPLAGCTIEEVDPGPAGAVAEPLPADEAPDADAEALELGARGGAVVATESPDEGAPLADATVYRLRRIVLGDDACTLDLQPDGGEAAMRLADVGVCSQAEVEELVGRRVRVELGSGTVRAETCGEESECEDRETVELVTRLYAAE